MAQLMGNHETESISLELEEIGKSLSSSFRRLTSSFRKSSGLTSANDDDVENQENALLWAELYRLPTIRRLRSSLVDGND
ncbi:hypothetical protein RHMOL_Rhmol11G0162000 [Rhododendron molle]|uniref:Uncharacterized protein n=1 Tax=Rhododendron molle TaxID=49168 RepID=A0ACC0LTV5_RHOML|nr:hypothetical protein RHMOL_Rhmol11G0162000 [Rhododendron molle]